MIRPACLLLVLALAGCAAPAPTATAATAATTNPAIASTSACDAQVPAGQASVDQGTLVVSVVDANGLVQAGATVQALGPNSGYHVACLAGASTTADTNGAARLDHMRVGTYRVTAVGANANGATAYAEVEPGRITSLTLTVAPIASN